MTAVRREGRTFIVPSRTRAGLEHRVDVTLDGQFMCNCEASAFGLECWAIAYVREELSMTTAAEPRALVPVNVMPPQALLPSERTYSLIDRAARLALSGSVSLPKELNTPEKVGAVMLYGWELGLKPMTALQELYIVNGRVQPSARIMAGLLQARTDARILIVESTDKKCTLRLVWPSRRLNETYTVEWPEIERAKLANSGTWATYPRDKLITHCTKRLLRVYAPDIINGIVGPVITGEGYEETDDAVDDDELYNPGEGRMVDVTTGEIIDADYSETPAVPLVTEQQLSSLVEWREAVLGKHGESAMRACAAYMKDRAPYAFEGDVRGWTSRLHEPDAASYLVLLKHVNASKDGKIPADGFKHERVDDEERGPMCGTCGITLDDDGMPSGAQAEQPALIS